MFPPEKLSGAGLFGKRAEEALGWILMNGFDLYDAPVSADALEI